MGQNKLIAEFMGYQLEIVDGEFYATKDDMLECLCVEEELHYHTSWDWLMPVVNRILFIKPEFEYVGDIEVTYPSVVEFIKQYNDGEQ